jgi:formylglycine-generating enzyme required for sulfatase activity
MHRLLAIIVTVASLAICASAQDRDKRVTPVDPTVRQKFERQVKVALLVGIGNYDVATGLPALKYPARDVELLTAELQRQGYLVTSLIDGRASRGVIRRTLHELASALDPDQGTFLFYFSGHGFQQDGRNYLATYGSTADDLKSEGLAVGDVEALLKETRAHQIMMFIDACRNDPSGGARAVEQRSFAALQAATGIRVLYSTRSGRVSFESDELRQGVFTYFLVHGLRGEAAGADGLVTFRDLADYVIEQTRIYGLKSGRVQVPYEAGESSGDFLLARAIAPTIKIIPDLNPGEVRPGQVKINNKDGQRYVWVPAGKFTIGCSPGDEDCKDDEKPAHNVTISKGFWLGQTLVTVGAWKKYAISNNQKMPDPPRYQGRPFNPGWRDEQQPMTMVTWGEAKSFCEWAGGRLPTEAAWEYAARAGTTGARYGNLDTIAWYADNSGKNHLDSKRILIVEPKFYSKRLTENGNAPHEVARKDPNAWNLYDMLGNVWQWTADWYDAKYYSRGDNRDPPGPISGHYRVLRGGSWDMDPSYVRVSNRLRSGPDVRVDLIGFRCAQE